MAVQYLSAKPQSQAGSLQAFRCEKRLEDMLQRNLVHATTGNQTLAARQELPSVPKVLFPSLRSESNRQLSAPLFRGLRINVFTTYQEFRLMQKSEGWELRPVSKSIYVC
jgi:hypothetical protein